MTLDRIESVVITSCQDLAREFDFNITVIDNLINAGIRDFVRRTKITNQNYTITTSDLSSGSTYDYALDGNIFKVYEVRFLEDSTADIGKILKPFPGGHAYLPRYKQFASEPDNYFVKYPGGNSSGARLGVWPISDTANYTISIDAHYFPADLSSASESPEMNAGYHDAFYEYAAWKLFEIFNKGLPDRIAKLQLHRNTYFDIVSLANNESNIDNDDEPRETIDIYHGSN